MLKTGVVELDCHVQLREVADVKMMYVSYDPATESGTVLQAPTIVATNVEVKRSIPLGDTLLLEMLSEDRSSDVDTKVMMLTCRKSSPDWAKESDAEKKHATDRAAAIAAAKELTFVALEEKRSAEVFYIKVGAGDEASDVKPRVFEALGMKFQLEGDVKFEIRNSGIQIRGKQLSIHMGDEFIGSCEEDGTIEFIVDEAGEVVSHKMSLAGRGKMQIAESIDWAADCIQYSSDDEWVKGTLEGNASFHYEDFTGQADRVTFDDTGVIKLSGRASFTRNLDGQPSTHVRGEKILVSGSGENGEDLNITVDPDDDSIDAKEMR